MAPAVLVMAKAPRPGQVKTRLEPALGPEACGRLQAALIAAACTWAAQVAPGRAHLSFGPEGAGPDEMAPHVPSGVRLFSDGAGDLGDRLAFATARVFEQHSGQLLVVGTDMPLLTPAHAREAERALEAADLCFGPALDGGYWLVGLRAPCPALFALGDAWGGPTVLERSLGAARRLGLGTHLIRTERDLDDEHDARALLADPGLPPGVASALAPLVT